MVLLNKSFRKCLFCAWYIEGVEGCLGTGRASLSRREEVLYVLPWERH